MALIIAARRTAIVPRGGAFRALPPHALAAPVIQALLQDGGVSGADIGQIFLSNALGAGGNPARMAALYAGLDHVSGISIDAQCAGGLDAIALAAAYVDAGFARAVIAGGSESFSCRPLRAHRASDGSATFYTQPPFSPFADQNPDMATAADALARQLGISRQDQDDYAVESHHKARAAQRDLTLEIIPLLGVDADPFTRDLTPKVAHRSKVLAGSVSAATTAPEADGAAFCLVVADDARPRNRAAVRIDGHCSVGADPTLPGLAPVPAIHQLLVRLDLSPQAFDVIEVMEAFSAQAIACQKQAGLPKERVNLAGGAIARGHPIGASGAVLMCHAFHKLAGKGGRALCAIAAAGGIGAAMVISDSQAHSPRQ